MLPELCLARPDELEAELTGDPGRYPALVVAGSRVYPTLKRGLGHGAACQKLVVANEPIAVKKAA